MDLILAVALTAPVPPYTPPPSGVDQNRSSIMTPQTRPTPDPAESWEQRMLRRYQRKVT